MINLFCAAAFCLIAGAEHAAAAQSCAPGRDQVALFMDDDFGGACVTLRVRDYPSPSSLNMVNDSVSSVLVGDNVQAVLCVDDGYGGECELFRGGAAVKTLTGSSIGNDRVSSVKVQADGLVECQPGPNEIALYKHKNFVTPCRRIGPGEYGLLANATLPNDSISSVKLGANVRAVLCDVKDYQGTCRLFHGDEKRLSGPSLEDNTVSSAWVFPRPSYRLPASIFVGRRDGAEDISLDRDKDGLRDSYEGVLAEQFKPVLKFDKQEGARRTNPQEPIVLFQVRPYSCVGRCNPVRVAIRWVFLFVRDGGYPQGQSGIGPCRIDWALDDHGGDNDRATFVLRSTDGGIVWELEQLHIAGPADPQKVSGKIIWPQAQLSPAGTHAGRLELNGLRHPYIYMSNGKHHMYLHKGDWVDSPYSRAEFLGADKLADDCGDDVDGDEEALDVDLRSVDPSRLLVNNVGEPEVAAALPQFFVNDLRNLFPAGPCPHGRTAWSNEKFCSNETEKNSNNWLAIPIIFNP